MISSHKRNIVNVMRSVSRLSRRVSGGGVIHYHLASPRCRYCTKYEPLQRFVWMALAKTAEAVLKIQAALFTQPKQGVNQRRLSRKKLGGRHQSLQARACALP
jgi:hypothetical protein